MKKNLQIGKKLALVVGLFLTVSAVKAADRYLIVASGQWNATSSWSTTAAGAPGASVPVAGDVVYIGVNRSVTIPSGYSAACTTLWITFGTGGTNSGSGTLVFQSSTASLAVSGDVTVGTTGSGSREGVIDMSAGGVMTIGGNLTIGNSGSSAPIASEVIQGANSSMTVTGNVSILSPGTNYSNQWQVNEGTAIINGTLTLANTASNNQDCNVIITTGSLEVVGAVTLSGAAAENLISITGAGILTLGNSISTGGTFTLSNASTVNYNGATQSIRAATYQNLTFSTSGAKTIPAGTTINGTLSIQGTSTIAGASSSPTYGGSAVLEYKGSVAQTTTNDEFPTTVNVDLVIDNPNGVTLNASKNLSGSLSLTNGLLNTTSANYLNIADGFNTVNGGSTSSYVNGPIRKTGNDAFTFPVGKSGVYAPVSISAPNENTDAFTVEYIRSSGAALGSVTAPGIFRVSNCEYWDITETADPGNNNSIDITLGWSANSGCGSIGYVTVPSQIKLVHFNGTSWDTQGGTSSGTTTSGTVTRTAVTVFSPFTLGSSIDDGNALPVTFSNIKAFEKGAAVQIDWTNLTESDLSAYVIERSVNGVDFTEIGTVAPRSNQVDAVSYSYLDMAPLSGTGFYRIKAVELSGKTVYTKSLRVTIGQGPKGITLYPNPVRGSEVNISFSASRGVYQLNVLNAAGQLVYRQQLNHAGGNAAQTLSLPASLKTGVYSLMISGDNYKETQRFVVQ